MLALRWRHVHLDRRVLEIRRNYVQRRGRRIEKDTKTHQMRRIALDPETMTVLDEHRDRALHRARLLDVPAIRPSVTGTCSPTTPPTAGR